MSEKTEFAKLWNRTLAFRPPASVRPRQKVSGRRCVLHLRDIWGQTKYFASYEHVDTAHRFYLWRPMYQGERHDGYQAMAWCVYNDGPVPVPWHLPFFLSQHSVDRVMQRCNCSSAVALDELRLLPSIMVNDLFETVGDIKQPSTLYARTPRGTLFTTVKPADENNKGVSVHATTWVRNCNLSLKQHQQLQGRCLVLESDDGCENQSAS